MVTRAIVSLLLLTGGATPLALSQAEPSSDGLHIPAGLLVCRPLASPPPDSGFRRVEFHEGGASGSGEGRTMVIQTDSLSRLVALVVIGVTAESMGVERTFGIVAELRPVPRGFKVAARDSLPVRADVSSPPPSKQPLDSTELARARALADWLWEHRCRVPPGPGAG